VRVLGVEIVFANVDHREFEQLREIHHLIQHALAERTFSDETHRNSPIAETLGSKRGTRGDSGATAYDCVRTQVAGRRVRDMHRPALAFAIAGFFAQQFGEHSIRGSAFG
jgi:hypothetical protein